MSTDPNAHPTIGPDHQLPAPDPAHPKHKAIRVAVWIALLVVFAVAFFLILRHHDDTAKSAASSRHGAGGAVAVTTATAKQGNLGVYLDAIGTVTPVYTASIVSQVTGPVVAVHYKEGQIVRKGESLVDIDPRPFRATLLQAQGTLERDQNVLAQAKMDLDRFRAAWARDAIPKQTLDDQEKLVLQDEGPSSWTKALCNSTRSRSATAT